MDSISFLHMADLHAGKNFHHASFGSVLGKSRRREIMDTFYRIVDMAVEARVDFLLIAGDLVEAEYISRRDLRNIQWKLEQAAGQSDLQVILIAGNHDYLSKDSIYADSAWPSNVTVMPPGFSVQRFVDKKTAIGAVSWDTAEMTALPEMAWDGDDSLFHILLLHGDLYGKDSPYRPLDLQRLQEIPAHYTALGHIHKPDIFRFPDGRGAAYPGSPEPLDFSETGSHGVIKGTLRREGGEVRLDFEFIPVAQRQFRILDFALTPDLSEQEVFARMEAGVGEMERKRDLCRFRLTGYRENFEGLDVEELRWRLLDSGFYYVEVQDETEPFYDLDSLKKEYAGSIIGRFIETMEEKIDRQEPYAQEALYQGLDALLQEMKKR